MISNTGSGDGRLDSDHALLFVASGKVSAALCFRGGNRGAVFVGKHVNRWKTYVSYVALFAVGVGLVLDVGGGVGVRITFGDYIAVEVAWLSSSTSRWRVGVISRRPV